MPANSRWDLIQRLKGKSPFMKVLLPVWWKEILDGVCKIKSQLYLNCDLGNPAYTPLSF
jgi:hypothetical protein